MYVGGRQPLHLQEDFCGTALLSSEWLYSDPRRTAVGLDLDIEALNWCIKNNVSKFGSDESSRISLFHRNVLQPFEAMLISLEPQESRTITICNHQASLEVGKVGSDRQIDLTASIEVCFLKTNLKQIPGRDIVCAFNYSCCYLHKRGDCFCSSRMCGVQFREKVVYLRWIYLAGHHQNRSYCFKGDFPILCTYGSKLNSTYWRGKHGSTCTIIYRTPRIRSAMLSRIVGSCGRFWRSRNAWKRPSFTRFISGCRRIRRGKRHEIRGGRELPAARFVECI